MPHYERYVAIGDSTSEGLDDPDGRGGYRGWANRLAEHIAARQGSVLYANLAIRGRTTRQIREEQLDKAVAMRPSLTTVVSGTNDLLRGRFDPAGLTQDIEAMQQAMIDAGATVLTFTLPDMRAVMPLSRLFDERRRRLNQIVRDVSARTGAIVADMDVYPVASDPRVWSGDRLHANSAGHARIAEALAYHAGYTDVGMAWAEPLPNPPRPTPLDLVKAEMAWMRIHFVPWLWRHARGISSGDGITAKFPELVRVEK
ncbi:MAG TPA: SGNH/GDSL hydrolase family protein [Thermoanaerobaculia bacterium]|nr:SGNH/GDSL hydrolase family protein [Thermoanaerobaculia bacterium]